MRWQVFWAAALLVGVAVGYSPSQALRDEPITMKDMDRAEVLTELEVNREMIGKAVKEYYKYTNQKPPSADDVLAAGEEPVRDKATQKALETSAELKHLYLVMNYGKKKANELMAHPERMKGKDGIPEPADSSNTAAMIASMVADYTKATGEKNIKTPKNKRRTFTAPTNTREVMQLLESVGQDLAELHNHTNKMKGASDTYNALVDRKIVIPDELGESSAVKESPAEEAGDYEDAAMDDVMANDSPKQMEQEFGLDQVDDGYESDKSTAEAVLAKQVDDTDYADVDSIPE
jgi:hypothetical protein